MKTEKITDLVLEKIENDKKYMDYEIAEAYSSINTADDDEINDFFCVIFEDTDATDKQVQDVINKVRETVQSAQEDIQNGEL